MSTLLVVPPDEQCPIERFGPWLMEFGASFSHVRPFAGDRIPTAVEADGLLVLGGDMGVGDAHTHPWIDDLSALTATAVADEIPTMGICLGGQVLASAMGGKVRRGAAGMEAGVIEIRARQEVRDDELMAGLPWPVLQGSMHRDAITELPPGAVWLAESAVYP